MFVSQPLASTLATGRHGEQLGERGVLSDNQRLRTGLNARSWGLGQKVNGEFVASSGLRLSSGRVRKHSVKFEVGHIVYLR